MLVLCHSPLGVCRRRATHLLNLVPRDLEKKASYYSPWHQGELNGGEKCKYGGGAGEVVRKGGVWLLVVFHLGLEGLKEEHPGMEVVLPVAASPPLPSREREGFFGITRATVTGLITLTCFLFLEACWIRSSKASEEEGGEVNFPKNQIRFR